VLFVGRLLPHKGIDLLIEGVDAGMPVRVIGQPYSAGYLAELRRLAEGKQVSFEFDADDDRVIDAMRRASLVVLPSLQRPRFGPQAPYAELLGLVLLEAMACGTPVVASDMGGIPEIVSDGVVGRLVPQGDARAIGDAVRELTCDRAAWARMSRDAAEHVRASFTWDHVARRCLEAYEAPDGTS
jgi:glycosyltransferase involved in cell wall biosynthesis